MFEGYDESALDGSEHMLEGGGRSIAVASGKQAHKMVCVLIGKDLVEVVLTT